MEEIIIYSLDGEIIDIEWCFINGHTPPRGRKYRYRVDNEYFITNHHEITGKEILENAGKEPKDYILRQKIHGSWVTIEPDQVVDLTKHGIEKFKTIKNEHTDGEEKEKSLRRDFSLPEEDEDFLNSLELDWETVQIEKAQWVFIYDYNLPNGYNVNKVILGVLITLNYPAAELDMLYFCPELARKDGIPVPNLSVVTVDGKAFQQWSRHRTPQNPWRVGIDSLSTHVPLSEVWLSNEFIKRPSHEIRA